MRVTEATQGLAPDFGAVWPEVSRRLRGYLLKRGVSVDDADDLVQTVAERALRCGVAFETAEGLLHWCLTVGRNLDVDRWRALSRRDETSLDQIAELDESVLLEDSVLTRMRLARTIAAIKIMRTRDREAILAGLDSQCAASGKDRVARYRARVRLLELVGPPGVIVLAFCRKLARPLTGPAPAPMAVAFTAALAAAVFVGAVVTPGFPILEVPDSMQAVVLHPAAGAERRTAVAHVDQASLASGPTASHGVAPGSGGGQTLLVTDQRGTVRLSAHDRRAQDAGLVCARDLPVIVSICVGPTSMPEATPPPKVTSPEADVVPGKPQTLAPLRAHG